LEPSAFPPAGLGYLVDVGLASLDSCASDLVRESVADQLVKTNKIVLDDAGADGIKGET
jgi:hypothetical protein